MLSYKLKHLCSRVIASLSAVGLISVGHTSKAHAADFSESEMFTYGYLTDTTFVAEYQEVNIECVTGGYIFATFSGVATSGVYEGQKVCTYILAPGYGVLQTSGDCISGSFSGTGSAYYMSGVSCERSTYSGVMLSGMLTSSEDPYSGMHLFDAVKAWASGSGYGDVTPYQWVVTFPATKDFSTVQIVPLEYRVDFSCSSGSFATEHTGVAYTRYGSDLKLPTASNCVPPAGYEFTNWTDGRQ